MKITEIKKTTEAKMDQSIASFKANLTKIRTGRANPALLDTVHVDYYGSMVPIGQVANVALLDARTISEERRREMTKIVRGEGESAKIAVRNLRRDANEAIKKLVKEKTATEDEQKRAEADIQKTTDRHVAEVDRLVAAKEQDIMAV